MYVALPRRANTTARWLEVFWLPNNMNVEKHSSIRFTMYGQDATVSRKQEVVARKRLQAALPLSLYFPGIRLEVGLRKTDTKKLMHVNPHCQH